MSTQTDLHSDIKTASTSNVAGVSAIFFGFVVILAIGFSPMDVVHNATHDNRHATGFPCH
ncbi:MAG: CbtB-domain containing protein [Methylococcales bacterium]|nr:CbtB-domain containing protein [Methylococcales bacterium]